MRKEILRVLTEAVNEKRYKMMEKMVTDLMKDEECMLDYYVQYSELEWGKIASFTGFVDTSITNYGHLQKVRDRYQAIMQQYFSVMGRFEVTINEPMYRNQYNDSLKKVGIDENGYETKVFTKKKETPGRETPGAEP